jgi:hypothetical protein
VPRGRVEHVPRAVSQVSRLDLVARRDGLNQAQSPQAHVLHGPACRRHVGEARGTHQDHVDRGGIHRPYNAPWPARARTRKREALPPGPPGCVSTRLLLVLAAWSADGRPGPARLPRDPVALAADLAQYGSSAQWKGIYYRGEKVGFSVADHPREWRLRGEGRRPTAAQPPGRDLPVRLRSSPGRLRFNLRDFSVSLDPGSSPTEIHGVLRGQRLSSPSRPGRGTVRRTRSARGARAPLQLLRGGWPRKVFAPGQSHRISVFDPMSLRNAPHGPPRGGPRGGRGRGRPVPAFRVRTSFRHPRHLLDHGRRRDRPRREPHGPRRCPRLETGRRPRGSGQGPDRPAASRGHRARKCHPHRRRDRRRTPACGSSASRLPGRRPPGRGPVRLGDVFEIRDLAPPARSQDPEALRFLAAELFVESDAPEIRAESARAVGDARDPRTGAERPCATSTLSSRRGRP